MAGRAPRRDDGGRWRIGECEREQEIHENPLSSEYVLESLRYLALGLAIKRRARRLAAFWDPHQLRTKQAQARWEASGGTLTVLGAGRLLDFHRDALLPRFDRFRMVDADPLSALAWRSLSKPVEPVLRDITGCIGDWTKELRRFKGGWEETLAFVQRQCDPVEAYAPASTDALLSLNLLSQLPVAWQDNVEAHLVRRFGGAFVEERESEWLDAVRPGNRMLVEQHLAAIERARPERVLIVCDVEYVQYFGRRYRRGRWEAEPVRWPQGAWEADEGVTCEVTPALEQVDLEGGAFARWMPSYSLEWSESWLWHIAPMAVECHHCGTIHRVVAFSLRRSSTAL